MAIVKVRLPAELTHFALRRRYSGLGSCLGRTRPLLKVALAMSGRPIDPGTKLTRFSPAKMSDAQSRPSSPPDRFSPSKIRARVLDLCQVFLPAKIPAPLPLLMALLGLFTFLVPRTLRVNVTPSVPLGLYRIVQVPVDRGSLVEICLPARLTSLALRRGYTGQGSCPGRTRPLLKEAFALTGDRIVLTRLGVARDGVLLPVSAPRSTDSEGRPLPHLLLGVYQLPVGSVWLYGPHPRSFDSRYFGPVSADLIRNTLVPLYTPP